MKGNLIEEIKIGTIKIERNSGVKENYINEKDVLFEKNMLEKGKMVSELIDMGLSVEAIERILKIEPDIMDKILK